MATKTVTQEITIMGDEDVVLKYDTGEDGKWQQGAYAKVTAVSVVAGDGEDGSCTSCDALPGSGEVGNGSVEVSLHLGRKSYNRSAGSLMLLENVPTNILSKPLGLRYGTIPTSAVDVITNASGLRQVKTPFCLADILVLSDYQYAVLFYHTNDFGAKTGGLYPTNGFAVPYVSWTFENPNGATNNDRLLVTESRGGNQYTNEFVWSASDQAWQLTTGNGLRTERRVVTWSSGNTYRTNLLQVLQTTNLIYQTKDTYQAFEWGEELVENRVGSDNDSSITTYTYWTSTSDNGYSRLKQVNGPAGNWEYYDYDGSGRKARTISGFKNASPSAYSDTNLCRVICYDYEPLEPFEETDDDGTVKPNRPRTVVEYLLGSKVNRSYFTYSDGEKRTIRCQTTNAAWYAADNLGTTNLYYTSGPFTDELSQIGWPDGTITTYEYVNDSSGTYRTNVVCVGQPDTTQTVTNGIRTVTAMWSAGQRISEETTDIASGIRTGLIIYSDFDLFYRPSRVTYLDGTWEGFGYECCGLTYFTNREGLVTMYSYDGLKRLQCESQNGIWTCYTNDAMGNLRTSVRQGTDANVIPLIRDRYSVAGQLVLSTNRLNGVTAYTNYIDGDGQLVKITTNPDDGTRIETNYRDGSVKSVTGTAAFPVYYGYGAYNGGTWTAQTNGSPDGAEWVKTWTDMLGRAWKTEYPGGAASTNFYNNLGQLWKQVDSDGVTTLYQYNAKGEREYTAIDLYQDGQLHKGGTNRITQVVSDVVTDTGLSANVRRTRTFVWPTDNTDAATLVSTVETSVEGLSTWNTTWNGTTAVTSQSRTVYATGGTRYVTNTAPEGSKTIGVYQYGRLQSVTRRGSGTPGDIITQTTCGYDTLGRQNTATDARNGTTTLGFNNANQVTNVTTPAPGNGQSPQTTTTAYDTSLRAWQVTQPDNTSVTNKYDVTGLLTNTFGSRTYPVAYTYDAQGRMKTMKTWTNYPSGNAATTTWNYDGYRGWLTNKLYADGYGIIYTNTAAGRLKSRTWARGLTTTYAYNNAGDLSTVFYSDSTAGVTNGYNRLGRLIGVTNGTTVCAFTFNDAGQQLVESYSGGPLNGLSVTNGYDQYLRRTNLSAFNGSTSLTHSSFAYDGASRLQTVSDGTSSATYNYLTDSSLIGQIAYAQSGATRMTTTKSYDNLNRLTQISSVPSAASAVSFSYLYNAANQRKRNTLADGSYWLYEYDSLGQVKRGAKYWSDGSPVAGQQFEYGFDDIGNRKSTKAGGDQNGGNLRSATYTPNNLNQYTSRDVPGAVDIMGVSFATNTVTVGGQTAYRKGEYFRDQLGVDNSSAALWTNIIVAATGQTSVTGNVFVAKTPELSYYDLDGNLTNDGRWVLTWDAENRLVRMESRTGAPTGSKLKLLFGYDAQGRRISKTVSNWVSGNWALLSTNRFVYDGWNLMAVLNSSSAVVQSFMWGLDLSGSLQGAGGVGGLLAVNDAANGVHFCAYDGNGNVAVLVKASDGKVSANYEYGPFGELLRATGLMAKANPFRFSTKYQDDETDMLYYGYRFYNASAGRWPSRDPLGEKGGLNLYGFVYNDPVQRFDIDGRLTGTKCLVCGQWYQGIHLNCPGRRLPPTIIVSTVKPYSCNSCKNAQAAAGLANRAAKSGKCLKWFEDHDAHGEAHVLMCRSSCNPATWVYDIWSAPGYSINMAPNACKFGNVQLASLLIHELGHTYCFPWDEACARSAQDACEDELLK